MRLVHGLIADRVGIRRIFEAQTVDAIESKIFQNRRPTRTQRTITRRYRCDRAAGLAQLRIAELEQAIWASTSTSNVASIVGSVWTMEWALAWMTMTKMIKVSNQSTSSLPCAPICGPAAASVHHPFNTLRHRRAPCRRQQSKSSSPEQHMEMAGRCAKRLAMR